MKKVILLLTLFSVLVSPIWAQETLDPSQYVNIQIGADTLSDGTHDPDKTVYQVESGQLYGFDGTLYVDFPLTIEGTTDTWLYDQSTPPTIIQTVGSDEDVRDMINLRAGGSITVKNILFEGLLSSDDNITSFIVNAAGDSIIADNCVFADHESHAIKVTAAAIKVSVTNCMFINGVRRRWNAYGGMPIRIDGFVDDVYLENNTSVNSARLLGNGKNFFESNFTELHCTYLNQQLNAHELHWYKGLQANNIFYNWSWRGRKPSTATYEACFTTAETYSSVSTKLDSISLYHGRNLLYLDPAFIDQYASTYDTDTLSRCYLWNLDVDSTVSADDDFTIGKNYWDIDPDFVTVPDNIDTMLAWVDGFWAETQPTNTPDWRIATPVVFTDGTSPVLTNWPPAFDLSYTDEGVMQAGTDGLPLGDLNWFPTDKATYDANRATYIAALEDSMINAKSLYTPGDSASAVIDEIIVGIKEESSLANEFSLSNNYPNPFNPTTTIQFSIPESGMVTMKVYNILGQEVRTIVNKEMTAGSYSVNFDASTLSSGVYIYTIRTGSYSASKKMMLLK